MQKCWLEDANRRPHIRDLVTTISNMESLAGYLDLRCPFSLVQRVEKDYSHSTRPKRTEMPILETYVEEEEEEEGEQSERGEGPAEAVQSDPEWGERRRVEEEEKGKSSKTIMESIVHETASYM